MRFLKASVIIMGVLIVIGTVVLVVGIINRSNRSTGDDSSVSVTRAGKTIHMPLGLPAGSTLDQVSPGARGVVLRVTVPGEGPVVYIVPWGGGQAVRITLGAGPATPPAAPKGAPAKP